MERTRRFFGFSLALMVGMVVLVILGGNVVGQQAFPPLGPLPPVPIPPDNPQTPAKVELGKLLYFDPRLSGDASTSCASCHDPKTDFLTTQMARRVYTRP